MKRLLITTALILISLAGWSQLDTINVGAFNNDPSADKLRPSLIKANSAIKQINRLSLYLTQPEEMAILRGALVTTIELNRLVGVTSPVQAQVNARLRTVDSTGITPGNYVTRKALMDSLDKHVVSEGAITSAIDNYILQGTPGVELADSNAYGSYTTRTYVESLLGSGGGMTTSRLSFTIGATPGAPANGDTVVVHTAFANKHLAIYRDGVFQYRNTTPTNTVPGFRQSGNTITIHPGWTTGERVVIDVIEPVYWASLVFENEESDLLDGLAGYWKLDEITGNIAVDATGTQNGTTYAGVRTPGVINNGFHINNQSAAIYLPYNQDLAINGPFSISMWIDIDTLASTRGRETIIFCIVNVDPQSTAHEIYMPHDGAYTDNFYFATRNVDGNWFSTVSQTTAVINTRYHIVAVNSGDSEIIDIYVNGVRDNKIDQAFTGVIRPTNALFVIGSNYVGSSSYTPGIYDEIGIWHRALTAGDVTELYNAGAGKQHPFE
jgi:hypothetical protein